MSNVYILYHMYEIEADEEWKLLGIYSSEEKYKEAIERYKGLEGFNRYPVESFVMNRYELDKDTGFTEGFISCDEASGFTNQDKNKN